MKNKFLIFMATITFFLTVAVVGILLKPELYESKTTVIKENDSMQSEVDEKNIESEVSNQEEWGSGDVYDGSSPIIRKMGEKLSVIGIPHRKQGDKPPMSTEVFAYWEGEMVFTVDSAVIYDSIEKTGLNLSNKIQYWWISKCIWIAASVFVYFTIALTCFSVTAIMLGAKANFEIGTYYPYFRFNSYDFVTEPPWNIMPTLLMLIPVGIGLGMIQLTVSMVISRLASYLVSTAILLMSAYMQSVLLFPNVSMFARSVEVVTNGQIAWVEVIIIAWISSICMLVGYLYLKNSDIINKHR